MKLAGTAEDRKLYYSILETVGSLCERYCPHTQMMPPGIAWKKAMVEEVIQKYPQFKAYPGGWPINTMIQMHRQLRKNGARYGIMRNTMAATSAKLASKAARPRPIKRVSSKGEAPTASSSGAICVRKAAEKTARIDSGVREAAAPLANGAATIVDAGANLHKPATFIEHFLESLSQDLSFLAPVFVDYGVVDEPALRGMLRMQDWRCWLYSWVAAGKLTELQFKMVIDGLAAV
ncbi:hypothetical protein OH77DRAFT_1584525 [Trametes cingulata]|nr:hypothetical protein OH77DRAFT_1584525 [Trametes cingulata]